MTPPELAPSQAASARPAPCRPDSSEYAPYYGLYIDQAPDGDILRILEEGVGTTRALLGSLSEEQERFRYAPEKWSVREIVGHLIDTEWTFTYRGLCFARTDPAELPGFDQDLWARSSNAEETPLAQLLDIFLAARQSSLAIYRSFDSERWNRSGVANACRFSVRAMPFILAGHEIHHRKVLEERYLNHL